MSALKPRDLCMAGSGYALGVGVFAMCDLMEIRIG
jgi:hypothetical protein